MLKKAIISIIILFLTAMASIVFAAESAVITLTVTVADEPGAWITNISDSPDAFSPNSDGNCDTAAINYHLINPGFVTVTLYNQSGVLVRTLKNNISETVGIQSAAWDGADENGLILNDGPYTYEIKVNNGSGTYSQIKQGSITIDNHFMIFTEPAQGSILTGIAQIRVMPSAYISNISGVAFYGRPVGSNEWNRAGTPVLQQDGSWLLTGDTIGAMNADYEVIVSAVYTDINNQPRNEYGQTLRYTITNPITISKVSDSPDAFSPNADGNYDTTTIEYRINMGANVTIRIYDNSDTLVRLLKDNVYDNPGGRSAVWDGRNDSGVMLGEGTYTYRIDAVDSFGNSAQTQQGTTAIDNNFMIIVEPAEESIVSGEVLLRAVPSVNTIDTYNISFTITKKGDEGGNYIDTLVKEPDGSWTCLWDTTELEPGVYEVSVCGEFLDLNNAQRREYSLPIELTVKEYIRIDNPMADERFSPNGDGRYDEANISYGLNKPAYITLKIYAADGSLARTLKDNEKGYLAEYSDIWDGRDDFGNLLEDGVYTYFIDAVDMEGNQARQVQGAVAIDNNHLTILSPSQGSVLSGNILFRVMPLVFSSTSCEITFYDGDDIIGTAQPDSDGSWFFIWDSANVQAGEHEININMSYEEPKKINITIENNNIISGVSDSPDAFSPNNGYDNTVISYSLSANSLVRVNILDANGNPVRGLKNNITEGPGRFDVEWDGRDDSGQILPDSRYTYEIQAALSAHTDVKRGEVSVNNYPVVFISPAPGASILGAIELNMASSAYINEVTGISLRYLKQGALPVSLGNAVKMPGNTFKFNFNTALFSNGECGIEAAARFVDFDGEESQGRVISRYVIVNGLAVSSNAFSPNADNYNDTTLFNYNLTSAGAVTIKISDAARNQARLLKNNAAEQAGINQAVWDGRDDSGAVLADGQYSYSIDIDYGAGNTAHQEVSVAIDNHFMRITEPQSESELSGTVTLRFLESGCVSNLNNITVYYRQKSKTEWQYLTGMYSANKTPNGQWQASWYTEGLNNGEYELCIAARYADLNGITRNEQSLPVSFTLNNEFSLAQVRDAPDAFSPNADGYYDESAISYAINDTANVTIEIKDSNSSLVRILRDNALEQPGAHQARWDGKDESGTVSADGIYTYMITARDISGTQLSQSGTVALDNNFMAFVSPSAGSVVSGNVLFKFRASQFVNSPVNVELLFNAKAYTAEKAVNGDWQVSINTADFDNGLQKFVINAWYYDRDEGWREESSQPAGFNFNNQGADISDLSITPNPFSPDGSGTWVDPVTNEVFNDPAAGLFLDDQAEISFSASASGYFNVGVENAAGNIIKQLADGVLTPDAVSGKITLIWDGSRDGWFNNKISNGTYRLIVRPANPDKTIVTDIMADKKPLIKNAKAAPSPFDPNIEKTIISFSLTEKSFVSINIYQDDILIGTFFEHYLCFADNSLKFAWDGRDINYNMFEAGKYTVRISAQTENGVQADPVDISVFLSADGENISNVRLENAAINPYNAQTAAIKYYLKSDMPLSIALWNDQDQLVRDLIVNEPRLTGEQTDFWDGKDNNGDIVPDGLYYFSISTVDASGQNRYLYYQAGKRGANISQEVPFTVTNFDPVRNQFCKLSYDLSEPAYICIRVRYSRYSGPALRVLKYDEPAAAGHYETYWDGRDESGDFVLFDTESAPVCVALWAYSANDNSIAVVGGRPGINSAQVSPVRLAAYPSPYSSSSQGRQAEITFALNRQAAVWIIIYNNEGVPVRAICAGELLQNGSHKFVWDGKNDQGETLKNGYYRINIQAEYEGNYSEPVCLHSELVY
jgi:flagellar hook assembly protein FlgD